LDLEQYTPSPVYLVYIIVDNFLGFGMKLCTIINKSTGNVISAKARYASSWLDLLVGMLNDDPEALPLILPSTSLIHTLGMKFPIDLYFFSRDWKCLKIVENVSNGRFVNGPKNSCHVLETISPTDDVRKDIPVGTQIELHFQ
jgi:hypothetical protein